MAVATPLRISLATTNVVAHEIAHSWTGNLVTTATWEHFWLNEGWTVHPLEKGHGYLRHGQGWSGTAAGFVRNLQLLVSDQIPSL